MSIPTIINIYYLFSHLHFWYYLHPYILFHLYFYLNICPHVYHSPPSFHWSLQPLPSSSSSLSFIISIPNSFFTSFLLHLLYLYLHFSFYIFLFHLHSYLILLLYPHSHFHLYFYHDLTLSQSISVSFSMFHHVFSNFTWLLTRNLLSFKTKSLLNGFTWVSFSSFSLDAVLIENKKKTQQCLTLKQ